MNKAKMESIKKNFIGYEETLKRAANDAEMVESWLKMAIERLCYDGENENDLTGKQLGLLLSAAWRRETSSLVPDYVLGWTPKKEASK